MQELELIKQAELEKRNEQGLEDIILSNGAEMVVPHVLRVAALRELKRRVAIRANKYWADFNLDEITKE
jgi:hypothetical protein